MGAPATLAGGRLFDRLSPLHQGAAVDGPLAALCDALMDPIAMVVEVADGDDPRPAWAPALDPNVAPAAALGWLAQLVGQTIQQGTSEQVARERVATGHLRRRGRRDSIQAAVMDTLTGSRTVLITERWQGSPWRLLIQVLRRETPDPARSEQVARDQVPVGIRFVWQVLDGVTYGIAEGRHATYAAAEAAWGTYAAVENTT